MAASGNSIIGGSARDIKRGNDTFVGLFGSLPNANTADATQSLVQSVMPVGGTVSKFYIRLGAAAGGAGTSYAFTVMNGATATSVTCTVTGAATTCNDTANSATFAAGDLISIKSDPSAAQPTDNLDVRWTAVFTPN